jgi:hypothetical protein
MKKLSICPADGEDRRGGLFTALLWKARLEVLLHSVGHRNARTGRVVPGRESAVAMVLVVRSRVRRRDMSLRALCQRQPRGRISIEEDDLEIKTKPLAVLERYLSAGGW